jgi:hypothetical protein
MLAELSNNAWISGFSLSVRVVSARQSRINNNNNSPVAVRSTHIPARALREKCACSAPMKRQPRTTATTRNTPSAHGHHAGITKLIAAAGILLVIR